MRVLPGLLLALLVMPAYGQTISTDRPDFGASASVLPTGTVQLEAGVKRTRIGDFDADQILESLLRFSVAAPIELRLGWTGFNRFNDRNSDQSSSGAGDISAGVKAVLSEGGRRAPSAALVLTLSLPSGDDAFSAGETVPEARLALAWSLGDRTGLTLNGGSYWLPVPEGLFGTGGGRERIDFYSVTLGRSSLAGHTLYLEGFGMLAGDAEDAHHLGVGYAFLVNDTLQLDVYGGSGLGDAASDAFIGAGFAFRFPD